MRDRVITIIEVIGKSSRICKGITNLIRVLKNRSEFIDGVSRLLCTYRRRACVHAYIYRVKKTCIYRLSNRNYTFIPHNNEVVK